MNTKLVKAKTSYIAAVLLAGILCLTGCINTRDDRSMCTVDMTFRFEYTLNEKSTDLFGEKAHSVDIYIYDESGAFVKMVRASRTEGTLDAGNTVSVNLIKGDYTAVAWANLDCGDYEYVYDGPLRNKRVSLKTNNSQVSGALGDLMHGMTLFTASTKESEAGEILVPMTKNTNKVKIVLNIKGNKSPVSEDMFIISITGSNGSYKYDNSFGECSPFTYIPQYSMSGPNVIQAEFNVLRLMQEDDLRLDIMHNTTRADIRLPLTDMLTKAIMQHPMYTSDNDLDRYDEYVLEYNVDVSNEGPAVIVMIKINDWIVVNWNGPIGQ